MDFTGFFYKGRHSSEFGLTRVSDGSRYQESLVPNSSVYTSEIPGGDGIYYFGKNFREKTFPIELAFDSISETQLRDLKNWLASDGLGDLVFDELPYKRWVCGIHNMPEIKYVCFIENGKRVYKGETSVEFISYNSYAFNNYGKCLDDYKYGNKNNLIYDKESALYTTGDDECAAKISLSNDRYYSIQQLGNYSRAYDPSFDYLDGLSETASSDDKKSAAFRKGKNIWELMKKNQNNPDGRYILGEETVIANGEELLKSLIFHKHQKV